VPRFVAAGPLDPMPYIVMERISGESLKSRLDEVPLPWPEAVAIGAKVAKALHDLHLQKVIHLDIKPSNVMIRETGEVVLIDYGFARHEQLPDLLAEEFREPFGTTPYMAPEQVLQDRADPRSDLFALGVMLYFFVTGERPFGNPRGGQIRKRLWRDPVPPRAPIVLAAVDLSPGAEDLAEALRLMVQRILSFETEARIACVNILKTSRIAVDILEDAEGNSLHVQRLVQLKHWGSSLEIPKERISYSVLEAPDPAAALVDYARHNNVDHIVIGARASSALRRYLGSVSSQVVAEAPCSVTVVRTPKDRRTENG
jgi:serine/threonine protein kinase